MTAPEDLLPLAREQLSTAVLSDALDRLGLVHQIMVSAIRPMDEHLRLCGRARTGLFHDVYETMHVDDDYEPVASLVGSLQQDEVPVLACGDSGRIQPWGGVLSVAAAMRGAAGCVTDGLVRDVRQMRAIAFPVFSRGFVPLQMRGRGRLAGVDVPVRCGGVWVWPGDIVFGDVDGVVVVPRDVHEEVLLSALDDAERERRIVSDLRRGAPIAAVYGRFRSL